MADGIKPGYQLVAVATLLLVVVRLLLGPLRLATVEQVARTIARVGTAGSRPTDPGEVGAAVESVADRLPETTCLPTAVAVHALLDAQGQRSELKIGVYRDWDGGVYTDDGVIFAHAWVEADGEVVASNGVDVTNYDVLVADAPGA